MRRLLLPLFVLVGCSSRVAPPAPIPTENLALRVESAGVSMASDGHGVFALRKRDAEARLRLSTHGAEPIKEILEPRPDGTELSWVFDRAPSSVSLTVERGAARRDANGIAVAVGDTTYRIGDGTWIDALGAHFPVAARLDGSSIVYDVPPAARFPATLDPTISAESDLDAPVLGSAPGTLASFLSTFDGTSFVVGWQQTLSNATRVRCTRVSTTGEVLDGLGTVLPFSAAVQPPRVASSGTESLFVWPSYTGKLELLAARVGKDGKLLDPTPISIASGVSISGVVVAWDGTNYAIVYETSDTKYKLVHVTKAGTVVEPSGIALPAVDGGNIVEALALACATSTCLLAHAGISDSSIKAIRMSSAGTVGTDAAVQPSPFSWYSAATALASNGTDFLHILGTDSAPVTAVRISALDVVSAPITVATSGHGSGLAGNSSGYLVTVRGDSAVSATMIPPSGTMTPTWTADIGPADGGYVPALGATKALVIGGARLRGQLFDTTAKPTTAPIPFAIAKGAPAQHQSSLSSDGTSYLATWFEEREGVGAIYARKYGKDGAPAAAAVRVRTFATSETPVDIVSAFDGTRHHVVYRVGIGGALETARVAADGTLVDASPRVLASGGYGTRQPTIASGDGHTLIVWIDGGEVFGLRLDAAGVVVGAPFPIGTSINTYDPASDARLGASWDGKRFLVSWASPVAASSDISGAFVDDTTVSAPFSISSWPSLQHDPASAFGGGVHLVAWLDLRPDLAPAIRAVRVAPDGKVLDASPVEVATDVCEVCAPTVRWDGGAFVLAIVKKMSFERVGEVVLARVRADGVKVDEPAWSMTKTATFPFSTSQPSMATDGKGGVMVATSQLEDDVASARIKLRAFQAKKPAGATCSAGSECDEGNCVDGLCCKTACTGPCEACDVAGALGTCTTVAGAPHGTRSCGASGDTCAAGACDGKDATKCASFSLAIGGVCGAPSCAENDFVGAPTCSDARACTAPSKVSCSPYRCATTGCLKTCAADDDCVDAAKCVAGSCVPSTSGARCTDDRLASVAKDGTITRCAPYRCDTDGSCGKSCVGSADCVAGFVCDVSTSTCMEPPAGDESSGGCSASGRTRAPGATIALLLVSAFVLRRRKSMAGLFALALLGCRSSEPAAEPLATSKSALVASMPHATNESTEDVAPTVRSAIACNATGCLYVSSRPPWIVAQRLGLDGTPLDAHGFVVASQRLGANALAVGTDGTDWLVAFERPFRPLGIVSVTAAGKASAVDDLVPSSTFADNPSIGWDGKSWVIGYQEARTGHATLDVVRIAKDGKHLDVFGTTVIDKIGTASPSGLVARVACDTAGCLVSGGDTFLQLGAVAHFADGKVDKGPTVLDFPATGLARLGSEILLAGPSSDGARAQRFSADATAVAPSKKIASGTFGQADLGLVAGAPVAVLPSTAYPYPVTLVKLDATLTPVTTSAPLDVPFQRSQHSASIGSSLFLATPAGAFTVSSSLAIARNPIERRAVPHRFPATASNGTARILAFARRTAGKDAVFVTKLADDGTIDPGPATLVANETAEIADVTATWDGTSFLVGWTTHARAATARVSPALSVLDPGGVAIVDATGSVNGLCGIRFTAMSTGTLTLVGYNNSLQVATVRIATTGKPIDTTPRVTALPSIACRLGVVTSSDVAYVVYSDQSVDSPFMALRFGADGKPIGTSVTVTTPHAKPAAEIIFGWNAALALDGTSLVLAVGEQRAGSLGYDIVLYRFPLDFSGAPYTPWIVSARDGDQHDAVLVTGGGKALIGWEESFGDRMELRASMVDLASKTVIVDAAKIDSFAAGEVARLLAPRFDGKSALIAYERTDPDPALLTTRIHARTITFGALSAATCSTSDDCELGPCVDGVCCDRACDGTCESCNEPSSVGTCVTVAGAPRGARACSGTGCAEATCDGFEPKACMKFSKGFETKCAEPTCAGALFTAPGYCDGSGTCAVPKTASCAPYACDVNGCRTSCASDASCAMGFSCKDGRCVAPESKASCDSEGLASIGADGVQKDCAPYRCGGEGTCLKTCSSSLDCAPGLPCDTATGTCGAAATEDSGGCALSSSKAFGRSHAIFGVVVALLGLRRRRRIGRV